ncbi:beta galactosidase jelly roll domain-containing protein [bacterium]|nr:beta galactosidase jelly roll domain-containing protein [bacterium]
MPGLSRRDFLSGAASAGALFSLTGCQAAGPAPGSAAIPAAGLTLPLCGEWLFRTDAEDKGETEAWHSGAQPAEGWETVQVPHTWQVVEETAEYKGPAWYRREFELPVLPAGAVVRVEFEAVYHSAKVWVNGAPVGEHLRKGYTAFTLDLSAVAKPGRNTLAVRVDNSFDKHMLPYDNSYDWTMDGGIYRPVQLLITGSAFIQALAVEALPAADNASAPLEAVLSLHNSAASPAAVTLECRVLDEASGLTVLDLPAASATLEAAATTQVKLPPAVLQAPRLWHFDHPNLYRFQARLLAGGQVMHCQESTFGVRRFEVRGNQFFLNGEPVRLMGVERMAGSHPLYGMAEPLSWIEHDHADMKELNCVFTRVHWQQDRRVLDWCDRHGMMIQLEVPCWGSDTFSHMKGTLEADIMNNGLEQLEEMIVRDRNHPSVVVWGLCNEIGGHDPVAAEFALRMYDRAKELDPARPRSYACNSLQKDPGADVAGKMDFIEWNEYYQSWYKGSQEDVRRNLEEIHAAFPDKPVVISEYGYCECTPRPEQMGGDPKRIEILRGQDAIFREFPWMAGLIFFCYNDYRTIWGDKGEAVLKQRLHGVVDLYGGHKPSYEVLRAESSPVESFGLSGKAADLQASLRLRPGLPAYTLRGYILRWVVYGFGGLPMESHQIELPELAPGQEYHSGLVFSLADPKRVWAEIVRPTGSSVLAAEWKP